MYLFKLLNVFVQIAKCICSNCKMYLFKLTQQFVICYLLLLAACGCGLLFRCVFCCLLFVIFVLGFIAWASVAVVCYLLFLVFGFIACYLVCVFCCLLFVICCYWFYCMTICWYGLLFVICCFWFYCLAICGCG